MNTKLTSLLIFLTLCATQLSGQQTASRFSARERGWWTFGLDGGLAYQSSDVRTQFNGWGAGLTLGKNLLYRPGGMFSFDVRGRGLFTRSDGTDALRSPTACKKMKPSQRLLPVRSGLPGRLCAQ